MTRSRAVPILINHANERTQLERIHLGSGTFDEGWLQSLIHDHPAILPISDIEPAFRDLISAGREIPCGHGFIDNLLITPSADIVLVEAKLWRNSQMRREVVAQALDYVAALTTMGYESFEKAVSRGEGAPASLYGLVSAHPEALGEAEFIDALSANLRRGRMLVIVVGDGIRSETEALSDLLQSHAGAHFTFALVELATWRSPMGEILVVPGILAKTVMIERGVVRLEHGAITVQPASRQTPSGPPGAQSISSSDFWESLSARDPNVPAAIRSLLVALEPLGVYPDLKASLNLKIDLADRDKPVNFGYITKNGQFWTGPASWNTPEMAWKPYFDELAELIGGTVVAGNENYVSTNGKSAPRISQFLPHHQDAMVAAIQGMIRRLHAVQ